MHQLLNDPTTRTYRYRDANGYLQSITISTRLYREIEAMDRKMRRRSKLHASHRLGFPEAGIDEASIESAPLPPREDLGNAWEGPRFKFPWLIGESRTWNGDPQFILDGEVYCSFCLGSVLPEMAYCLGCDRCGRENEIRTASVEERRTRQLPQTNGLKGGK